MPITAPAPYEKPEIPAIPAKVFENLWLLDLVINGRSGRLDEASAYMNVAPCDAKTGEIDFAAQRDATVRLADFLELPAQDGGQSPNPLAMAMHFVELAVPWVLIQKARMDAEREAAQAKADGLVSPE
jgi:hypothetical protein